MTDPSWRPERAISISDALDELLNAVEAISDPPLVDIIDDSQVISTGITALDRVCRGGLRVGTVTLLDCAMDAHAQALLYSTARRTQAATVLAGLNRLATTRWLLAGSSGVAATLIDTGHVSVRNWQAIASTIAELAERELHIAEVASIAGLRHVAATTNPSVLLVERPELLGEFGFILQNLVRLAQTHRLAILCSTAQAPGHTDWGLAGLERVFVDPSTRGSQARLVTDHETDGMSEALVEIALLEGSVC